MRGLTHPLAEDYLDRLDRAAASLPPNDRVELLADIRGHLADVIPPDATDADVRNLLQELGSPEEVAAAAYADGGTPLPLPPPPPPVPPPTVGYPSPMPAAPPSPSTWGPVEICAVVGLTAGFFVVPVVGPVAGLVLAWVSDRWTRREKVVATVLTLVPVIVLVLAGLALTTVGSSGSGGSSTDHGPVVTGTPVGGTP